MRHTSSVCLHPSVRLSRAHVNSKTKTMQRSKLRDRLPRNIWSNWQNSFEVKDQGQGHWGGNVKLVFGACIRIREGRISIYTKLGSE